MAALSLLLITILLFVSFLPLSIHSEERPSYLSWPITNRDAQASLIRTQDADPSDFPKEFPMRELIAAGRAMKAREEKRNEARWAKSRAAGGPSFVGSFTYLGDSAGDFYLLASVGNPPQHITFTLDTGSELILTKCKPCLNCTKSNAPLFEYGKSTSFMRVPCDSALCKPSLGLTNSCFAKTCGFVVQYGDNSLDAGYISVDSFHLSKEVSKSLVFGCAVIENDPVGVPASGTMGLNAGPFSFPSQLIQDWHSTKKPSNKFAHCLPDRFRHLNSLGQFLFGDYSLPSIKLTYTPLVPPFGPLAHLYYYVKLEGISVGNKFIKSTLETKGIEVMGTIFDSGTAFSRLVEPLYSNVVQELKQQTSHLHPFSEKGFATDVCYRMPMHLKDLPKVPLVVMHFAGEAKLELGPESVLYLAEADEKNGYKYCVAFEKALLNDPLNIIANYQQQNYWVEYNLEASSIGLAKATCATK